MNVYDKLLGLDLDEDLTETTWWTETVFRGLEKGGTEKQDRSIEISAAANQSRIELH